MGALFGNTFWHRAGHPLASTAVCFALLLLWPRWPTTVAWLVGCEVLPRLLESIDTYAGGFMVTWEERKAIWKRHRDRAFRLSEDSINDLWEYRLAWLLYPLAVAVWGC